MGNHSTLPQHLPPIPPPLPPRRRTLNPRIQPQTLRPPHLFNRDQIPRIHRLHMPHYHINLPLRIPLLPLPAGRMHRLYFISSPIQPPRTLHLSASGPAIAASHGITTSYRPADSTSVVPFPDTYPSPRRKGATYKFL